MRRYRLLFNLKTSVAEVDNADLKGFRVTFAPNLPKAVLEELKVLVDSGAELSQETILGLSSFVTDVPAEIERVKSEQPVIEMPDYFEKTDVDE